MKKLTVGVLALGCLALLIGTIGVTLPMTGQAQTGFRPDFAGCAASGSLDLCKNGKVRICHFNLGADNGNPKCQEESGGAADQGGYNAHISADSPQGHNRDFCITSAEDEAACKKGEIPPPPGK